MKKRLIIIIGLGGWVIPPFKKVRGTYYRFVVTIDDPAKYE